MSATTPGSPVVPGAVHRVVVERRDSRGRGIANLERRELRIPNALPGETLDVALVHVGRHMAVGRIAAVVTGSTERVRDACRHGDVCPGCGLRTSSRADRLAFKRARIVTALAAAGLGEVPVAGTVAAPSEDGWRHKAYVTPRQTRKGIVVGLFEDGTHRLVAIHGCPQHAPVVEKTVEALRRALTMAQPSVYDERSLQGWLRHVSVRASRATGAVVVVLVVKEPNADATERLTAELRLHGPHITGVVVNLHPEPGNAPFGDRFGTAWGEATIEEASGPDHFVVSAGSFFQVNPAAAEGLQEALVAQTLGAPKGHVLDLYGGVGVTAVRATRLGRTVTLVESPGPAADDAATNCEKLAPGRVHILASTVEGVIEESLRAAPAVVVANPPRSGLSTGVREALAAAPAPVLLYVSCDPDTLARDASKLCAGGWSMTSVTPYDLMPQTSHVEALAVFAARR